MTTDELRALIRDVADCPQPGIVFNGITPLPAHPRGCTHTVDLLARRLRTGRARLGARPIESLISFT